eukprot:TRINITY_DN30983_c0_g1_i1.p1 TRINITY_DN30983_c0_g1~~TRINITY_DN30983_c0_g1_i1.p1  ORF type:complete len:327 (+),score=106.30 TRINITY_DN30983_c0_g1_i1:54-983(+)
MRTGLLLSVAALRGVAAAGVVPECPTRPCQPWRDDGTTGPGKTGGGSCGKSDPMDFRLAYGSFDCTDPADMCCGTNLFGYNDTQKQCSANPSAGIGDTSGSCSLTGGVPPCFGYRTHVFCPKTDHFQQFRLDGSGKILRYSSPRQDLEMIAFGHGLYAAERIPNVTQYARAIVYSHNNSDCDGGPAIATLLEYNVTLRDGKFRYKNRQPIGNGFMPTCDGPGKQCKFDSSSTCIGKEGTKQYNCAVCVKDQQNTELDLQVMVTYYGTDSGGHTLVSGSSNPLNYREFADADVYGDVWGKAKGFKPSLPF